MYPTINFISYKVFRNKQASNKEMLIRYFQYIRQKTMIISSLLPAEQLGKLEKFTTDSTQALLNKASGVPSDEEIENHISSFSYNLQLNIIAKYFSRPMKLSRCFNFKTGHNGKYPGVGIAMYVALDDDNKKKLNKQSVDEIESLVRTVDSGKTTFSGLLTVPENADAEMKVIYNNSEGFQRKTYHAEDRFFLCEFPVFLARLKDLKIKYPDLFSVNKSRDDDLLLSHLVTYPRIEVQMTTEPCGNCQRYFMAIRKRLNELQIHVSIVIFTNSPFQNESLQFSLVRCANNAGQYCETYIPCDLPFNKGRAVEQAQCYPRHALVSQQQQEFYAVSNVVTSAMPHLLSAPLQVKVRFLENLYNTVYSRADGRVYVDPQQHRYMALLAKQLPTEFIPSRPDRCDNSYLMAAIGCGQDAAQRTQMYENCVLVEGGYVSENMASMIAFAFHNAVYLYGGDIVYGIWTDGKTLELEKMPKEELKLVINRSLVLQDEYLDWYLTNFVDDQHGKVSKYYFSLSNVQALRLKIGLENFAVGILIYQLFRNGRANEITAEERRVWQKYKLSRYFGFE